VPDLVLVTADVAHLAAGRGTPLQPGGAVGDAVVLASAASRRAWDGDALAGGVWVVVGDGDAPGAPAPFLRLPAAATPELVEVALSAARQAAELRRRLAAAQQELTQAGERQLDLVRVGIALTAERDLDRLLELILTTAREQVSADAGSLYLVEDGPAGKALRFVLAQNDSVAVALTAATVALDSSSLAGHVAVSGETVSVPDVRRLDAELPFRFNPSFDLASGYHTRSLLGTPLATRSGEVVGVLQLINRKRDPGARIDSAEAADAAVVPFGATEVTLLRAFAAQAAVAIENTRLVMEIERLFEGFVRASVRAIEQRDPTTSGHSQRVAHYTLTLAQAVERTPPPEYRGFGLSRDGWTQLRYAALLHDFGKVGVPEAVLRKGRKLYPERLQTVLERFRHARRAHEVALLRRLLGQLVAHRRVAEGADLAALDRAVEQLDADLDQRLGAVLEANEPSVLAAGTSHLLQRVAHEVFPGTDGESLPLLLPEEVRALAVPRGSLDEEERRQIEDHVVHSYQFLLTIPWPRRLARIPEIAYGHHEKLNGRGYPNRLLKDQIPAEVRMMTVCDIYDALTAGDRPYKRSVSPERAIGILEAEAAEGFVDPDLVRLCVEARVFSRPPADQFVL